MCYPGRMSLVQLESFVVVAEEGHLGRAARRLHVSQPPLTRRIRSLEDELGVSLFDRTSRGMALRPEGAHLLDHARDILARVERVRNSFGRASSRPDDEPDGQPPSREADLLLQRG